MFLAELKKNLIEFCQVINSYFTEKILHTQYKVIRTTVGKISNAQTQG